MANQLLKKPIGFLSRAVTHIHGELELIPYYLSPGNSESKVAIFAPDWFPQHFQSEALWRRAYAISLIKRKIPFEIFSNPTKAQASQKVIWRASASFIPRDKRQSQYKSEVWVGMAKEIERRGSKLYPDSRVISFYENKINMHRMFEEAGVKSPRTLVVREAKEYEDSVNAVGIPFIVKGPYSYSSLHISLIASSEQALRLKTHLFSADAADANSFFPSSLRPPVLIQQFLNIRRDLRVVFVGEEILLSYWRINKDETWKPTATRFGSKVSFEPVPQQWKSNIVDTIRRIDFPWGAFDIAWNNDDLGDEPYILEVSPVFEPNPPPPSVYLDNYNNFKYGSSFKHSWFSYYWKIVQRIADAQIEYLFRT